MSELFIRIAYNQMKKQRVKVQSAVNRFLVYTQQ